MSSSSILTVLRSGSPRKDAGPVTEKIAPIFIGSAAQATAPDSRTKINTKTSPVLPFIALSSRGLYFR